MTAPPAIADRMQRMQDNLLRMMERGVPVVCATDGGVGPPKPHDVLPYALLSLVEAGLPVTEVLATATSRAAELCGLGHRKGRVAAGYDADLLVVRGNPWGDPQALLEVHSVYRAGIQVR